MADKKEFDEFDDQYYEIYDSIKIIYSLTCDPCGYCAERHQMMDKDEATEQFESGGFIFKNDKIMCNACKDD